MELRITNHYERCLEKVERSNASDWSIFHLRSERDHQGCNCPPRFTFLSMRKKYGYPCFTAQTFFQSFRSFSIDCLAKAVREAIENEEKLQTGFTLKDKDFVVDLVSTNQF